MVFQAISRSDRPNQAPSPVVTITQFPSHKRGSRVHIYLNRTVLRMLNDPAYVTLAWDNAKRLLRIAKASPTDLNAYTLNKGFIRIASAKLDHLNCDFSNSRQVSACSDSLDSVVIDLSEVPYSHTLRTQGLVDTSCCGHRLTDGVREHWDRDYPDLVEAEFKCACGESIWLEVDGIRWNKFISMWDSHLQDVWQIELDRYEKGRP